MVVRTKYDVELWRLHTLLGMVHDIKFVMELSHRFLYLSYGHDSEALTRQLDDNIYQI